MQKITFAQVGGWIVTAIAATLWALGRMGECIAFAAELVLISIALFCYCCVVRKLPTQLQEEELLAEYQAGVNFGRKDTLEKLSQLGPAFKLMPDGAVQTITDETAAAAAMSNKQLSN